MEWFACFGLEEEQMAAQVIPDVSDTEEGKGWMENRVCKAQRKNMA